MPSWGWLNGIIGNQGDVQQGQAQQGGQVIHDPNRDTFSMYPSQQISNQLAQQQAMQQQAAQGYVDNSMPFGSMSVLRAYAEALNATLFEYDTSNETTRKMCDVIMKASEGLKAMAKVKESV